MGIPSQSVHGCEETFHIGLVKGCRRGISSAAMKEGIDVGFILLLTFSLFQKNLSVTAEKTLNY